MSQNGRIPILVHAHSQLQDSDRPLGNHEHPREGHCSHDGYLHPIRTQSSGNHLCRRTIQVYQVFLEERRVDIVIAI